MLFVPSRASLLARMLFVALGLCIATFTTRTLDAQTMPSMSHGDSMPMKMMTADPLGVSMNRMGSGTTWIPDAVPLPSSFFTAGRWDLTLHGFVFVQQNGQGGKRGASQFGSLNWGMFMASHELAGGRFQARTMLSLDPATVTPRGYPLLLQTGESFHGEQLHDRQHPHDVWMELGLLYERPVSKRLGFLVYAAPSGEPALGPVAFMHRPSAMDNPTAPIGHHWQDATHISFGVVTAGIFGNKWKLEGSAFNGREPDENRWDFDPIRLNSYSGRLTVNPTANWSFTTGYGFIHSPEALNPTEDIHRITASALYGKTFGTGEWSSAVVWGANTSPGHTTLSQSLLFEADVILDASNTVLGRSEFVQKSAEELAVSPPSGSFQPNTIFNVGTLSLGYIRELTQWAGMSVGLGGMGTLNVVPAALQPTYGSRTPLAGFVFLRLRARRQQPMAGMGDMKMN